MEKMEGCLLMVNPVKMLCCPHCKEKSTLLQGNKGTLRRYTYILKGGKLSSFGGAVKDEELVKYNCLACKNEFGREELFESETEYVTVSWTDRKTGEQIIVRKKKGVSFKEQAKKKGGKTYWNKQNNLLKRLRKG